MLVLVALIIIVFSFQQSVVVDDLIAANQSEDAITAWAARGGVYRAVPYLRLDDEAAFDSLNEEWSTASQATFGNETPFRLGQARVSVQVVDEERKFNILATLVEDEDAAQQAAVILVRLIRTARREDDGGTLDDNELDAEEITDNIIEWLADDGSSSDQDVTLDEGPSAGAREDADDVEIKKVSPYPILTIAELMQVEGVSRSLLYGPPRRTFEDSAEESTFEDETSFEQDAERLPLIDLITCYTRQAERVNINTASSEVLMALTDLMTQEIADAIINARQIPEDELEQQQNEPPPEGETEWPDEYSFRQGDIRSSALDNFRTKLVEQGDLSDGELVTDELWAEFQPRLTVRSEVYSIIATAVTERQDEYGDFSQGRIQQTWRGLFLRYTDGGSFATQLMILDRVE